MPAVTGWGPQLFDLNSNRENPPNTSGDCTEICDDLDLKKLEVGPLSTTFIKTWKKAAPCSWKPQTRFQHSRKKQTNKNYRVVLDFHSFTTDHHWGYFSAYICLMFIFYSKYDHHKCAWNVMNLGFERPRQGVHVFHYNTELYTWWWKQTEQTAAGRKQTKMAPCSIISGI